MGRRTQPANLLGPCLAWHGQLLITSMEDARGLEIITSAETLATQDPGESGAISVQTRTGDIVESGLVVGITIRGSKRNSVIFY